MHYTEHPSTIRPNLIYNMSSIFGSSPNMNVVTSAVTNGINNMFRNVTKDVVTPAVVVASCSETQAEEPLICAVCFDGLTPENTTTLQSCGHKFCKSCIRTLKHRSTVCDDEGLGIKLVKCPMCRGVDGVTTENMKLRIR